MNHARRQFRAVGQNWREDQQRLMVGVCCGQCDQEEGVDEASFKQPEVTSGLQDLIVTRHFKCPDVCSNSNKHGKEQSIRVSALLTSSHQRCQTTQVGRVFCWTCYTQADKNCWECDS